MLMETALGRYLCVEEVRGQEGQKRNMKGNAISPGVVPLTPVGAFVGASEGDGVTAGVGAAVGGFVAGCAVQKARWRDRKRTLSIIEEAVGR